MKLENLYNALEELTKTNEAFYSASQEININGTDYIVKSYSYRLASWSDFQLPYAKEARGTAFYSAKGSDEWHLFCRAYKKFFNLGEVIPVNEFIETHEPVASFEKLDGSLILFGMIEDKVIAKSKTSINSEQAQLAQSIVDNNTELRNFIVEDIIKTEHTPVFELVGPSNVIVLRYQNDDLVFLGRVDNSDCSELPVDVDISKSLEKRGISFAKIYKHTWGELLEIKETSKPHIEGFVVQTNEDFVKVKVNSYISLHHLKDSVNNLKSLSALIVSDNLDDLIGSFQDDQATVDYIVSMQEKIGHKYNHLVANVEDLFEKYKHLERKDFAIKTREEVADYFPLLMNKYLGKKIDYKDYFMKRKMYLD